MVVSGFDLFGGESIKSIQKGSVYTSGISNTINVNKVDRDKSLVLVDTICDDPTVTYGRIGVIATLQSDTTLFLERNAIADNKPANINWTIIEFSDVKSFQKGNFISNSLNQSVPISTIDPSKSLVVFSYITNFSGLDVAVGIHQSNLTSNTIEFVRKQGTVFTFHYQVIEFK